MPLLTLLLPARIATMTGTDRIWWLSMATLLGAIAASLSNVLAGWASDLCGSRRRWASIGLVATLGSYLPLAVATTPTGLVIAVVVFQLAVNLLLAPLVAWAADQVPDDRKGILGGLLGAGPAVGALAGVLATLPSLSGEAGLAVIAMLLTVLTLPLFTLPAAVIPPTPDRALVSPRHARRDFALLWCARLLVQIATAVLFAFLLFYFQSLTDAPAAPQVARLNALVLAIGFPVTLIVGRVSDRLGPRRPFLIGAAVAMVAGLAVMACAIANPLAAIGYFSFGVGMSVFLSLHATFAMQLLPRPDRHGRDLGVLNLANTLPQMAATLLTAGLVPRYGYAALLTTLAGGVVLAALCTVFVRCDRQAA